MPPRDISKGSPVLRRDAVLLTASGSSLPVPSTLMDTGSIAYSFISPQFLRLHPELCPELLPTPVVVKLGDNRTTITMSHFVNVSLMFVHDGREYRGSLRPLVYETGYDFLVGLPDILHYFPQFMAMQILMAAQNLSEDEVVGMLAMITDNLYNPDNQPLLSPWASLSRELAPEDMDPDNDCIHPSLAYLSKPLSEFCADFYRSLETHVPDEDFKARPAIRAALFDGGYVDVFCPPSWHGIYDSAAPSILPLELDFHESMPKFIRPFCPPVPAKMQDVFDPEWRRLTTYQYTKAAKPGAYASPLVCAPKTNPDGSRTVRVAGDYRAMNVWIKRSQLQTPNPYLAAQAASKFPWKIDLDLKNGFHSLRLGPKTREMLAVNAPDGIYLPTHLPEGIGPAIGYFQAVMNEIFFDFITEGWAFVIVDNIVLGSMSADDSESKLLRVLQRCREAGLTLKFEKSWFHVRTVKFFGFEVGDGTICMDKKRIASLLEIPLPGSLTKMRSFLGCANFFMRFVYDYSRLAAPLYETTATGHDWSQPLTDAHVEAFNVLKQACASSVELFTPDYDNPFLVRCDACNIGIGGVLLMLLPTTHPTHPGQLVPIAFCSHKFSAQAQNWSTWDQELFSIHYSVTKEFRHYLYGKTFVVENDHRNLMWLESSQVPKVVRWRLALQDFDFKVRHIPGKDQVVADYFSRLHMLGIDSLVRRPSPFAHEITSTCYDTESYAGDGSRFDPFCAPCISLCVLNPDETRTAFETVHSNRAGHHGAHRTYHLLHRAYPGHRVPFSVIRDLVAGCAYCQKMRATSNLVLREQQTHLELTAYPSRGWVGIDILTVTMSKKGNCKLIVFVVLDTKRVVLVPVPDEETLTVARACFIFLMQFGEYKGFTTDPGSTFMSGVLAQLNEWLGSLHRISLVDRHESCGVERTNGSVLSHLKALVFAERATNFWDEPEYLMTVQNILNTTSDTECGLSPNELTYGSADLIYFQLPGPLLDPDAKHEYLRNLNSYIQTARLESEIHHLQVLNERAAVNGDILRSQTFLPGSLVLWVPPSRSRIHKLRPTLLGPYEVIQEERGEVSCRQLATKAVKVFHITRLKEFFGDSADAYELAKRDDDQYGVSTILGYRGEPVSRRRYMTFLLRYDDADESWVQYCPDLVSNICWQEYCASRPELKILLLSSVQAGIEIANLRRLSIPRQICPQEFYLDLRCVDFTWYDQCALPNSDTATYVVLASFIKFTNRSCTRGDVYLPVLDVRLSKLDYYWFKTNAHRVQLEPALVTLVDARFVLANPQLVSRDSDRLRELRSSLSAPLAGSPAQRRGIFQASEPATVPHGHKSTPRTTSRVTFADNQAPHPAPTPDPPTAPVRLSSPRQSPRLRSRTPSPSEGERVM